MAIAAFTAPTVTVTNVRFVGMPDANGMCQVALDCSFSVTSNSITQTSQSSITVLCGAQSYATLAAGIKGQTLSLPLPATV